ncbi:MAG TPA: TonB-dependent receptor [Burkholderiales bacterium]|nr:TonB-dependent receptor [Burkholderiales bacterium]
MTLAELSLEELGNIEITSVRRTPERLSDAAAAIFVITRDDILRSGVVTIPEALRLAPNLQVARVDATQYAINARGFNTATSNQLLVLIDGRSVYTPLYSGVFWDVQDVLMEDIDRIEVISGPGGALWGSNAVNGVINIVTRSAHETKDTVVLGAAGSETRAHVSFRHGGELSDTASYRIHGKYLDQDSTVRANGADVPDASRKGQIGFRLDWDKAADTFTVQGDAYKGETDQAAVDDKTVAGANLLGRWSRSLGADSNVQLQVYHDHTERDYPGTFKEIRNTTDIELQHRFKPAKRHEIVWGGGYRSSSDHVTNSATLAFLPTHVRLNLANLFLQDSITLIPERLDLTLGSKFERNDYTGLEIQPSARVAWKMKDRQLLWGAISRAVRTPSRIDRQLFSPGSPPFLLAGGADFRSETLLAYELGYRIQAHARASLSISTFYNVYDHLRSLEPQPSGAFVIGNEMEGSTYGAELWGDLEVTKWWRIKAGYAYLEKDLRLSSNSRDPNGVRPSGNDAKHRITLRSSMDITPTLALDGTLRYVSALPNPSVPAYTTLDLRLGWKATKELEVALIGQNLLDKQHPEFGSAPNRSEIERNVMVRATWRF